MKVSELWLREIINPRVTTQTWLDQFTQAGMEVDSLETIDINKTEKDTIATLKVPPNRGDCLSMEGLAREWAVINKLHFDPILTTVVLPNIKDTLPLNVLAKEACPSYVGRILQNVNVNVETPDWIKERLERAGVRSLSPVVDVTNYVMLELGQPMHAFDLAKIDSTVVVRMANAEETLKTLDGKMVTLDENTLVIADKTKVLAIAGIVGGEESAVSDTTKNIFLESAYFNPVHIRKTSQRFKLRTESSQRFERGIDHHLQTKAIERATELLAKIVGGNIGPLVEYSSMEHSPKEVNISLRSSRIQAILGISHSEIDVPGILQRLGIKTRQNDMGWEATVPSNRPDIQLEIDLIEELARIHGYQNIPEVLPCITLAGDFIPESEVSLSSIKNILISRGYKEAITYSFIAPEYHRLLNQKHDPLRLTNPISQEMSVMRESLLPGLLQVLKYNQDRQALRLRCFETGVVFQKATDNFQEKTVIAGLVSNTLLQEQWGRKTENVDFFDVKNDIESLFDAITAKNNLEFKSSTHSLLHPSQTAEIFLDDKSIGFLGSLHPAVLGQLELQGPVIMFELYLKDVQRRQKLKFSEVSKYPAIRRDIAVLVDEKMLAKELMSAIVNCVGPLLKDIWVFDVYQGKGIEKGRKSIGFGLLLQHPSRTLVEEEVTGIMNKVIGLLAEQYQAILRE